MADGDWVATDRLSFRQLRAANVERCELAFHPLDAWSETDWGCALAGEVGEALTLLKKRLRGEPIPTEQVAAELADAVTYADLLAARMGIDLGDAVRRKFDAVSARIGSDVLLGWPDTAYDEQVQARLGALVDDA